MPAPVCVTGGTGFIGGHIVEQFLLLGRTVHVTVRDPAAPRAQFLVALGARHAHLGGKAVLFAADLTVAGSFDAAVAGCEVVVHVAAVVQFHYRTDPFAEVIEPGLAGVRNVVAACQKHKVRRIVFTSSVSTITTIDEHRAPAARGTPLAEGEWVTHVTPTYGTYAYAKIAAERLLDELWAGECVKLLPAFCLGPQQNAAVTSTQKAIRALVNGEYGLVPPMVNWFVDVRDVARAHVFAATEAGLAGGRYSVCHPQPRPLADVARALNRAEPGLRLATRELPWAALWAASWFLRAEPVTSHFLYEQCVPCPALSNARILAAGCEFKYPGFDDTVSAALASFHQHGLIAAAKSS
jgi:nucleoside-diphosphate-sugar epimerase